MILEVIATCMEDAIIAEQNGADRIELITAITEGGLTPGIGLVEKVVNTVNIPVFVMVRPHSRSFFYSYEDLLTMAAEIKAIKSTGAAGVVLGALTEDKQIDEQALQLLLPLTNGMEVTFHRAFDELSDQLLGLDILKKYNQITRILTSAGSKPAPESIGQMRDLVKAAQSSNITILAGSGLKIDSIVHFIEETGVTEVHFGTAVRYNNNVLASIDPNCLQILAQIVNKNSL